MTNLADLSADSKFPNNPLKSSLDHLTSALSGMIVTIDLLMQKPYIKDDEYDQMSMLIMALQRAISHIEFDWPDFDQDIGLE